MQFFRLNWIVPTTPLAVRLDQAARFSKLSSQPCYRGGVGQTFAEVVHSTKKLQLFGGSRKKWRYPNSKPFQSNWIFFLFFFFGRTGKDPMRSTQPLLSIILSTFCRSHLRLRGQGIERRFSPFESLQLKFWHQESSETCGSAGSAGLFFWKAMDCFKVLTGWTNRWPLALQQHPNWELNSTPPQLKAEAWNLLFFQLAGSAFLQRHATLDSNGQSLCRGPASAELFGFSDCANF